MQREEFAHRVGDRRATRHDQGTARIDRLDEAGLDVEVPGTLRATGIHALERAHVGGEGELAELVRFVDDELVDADLAEGQEVVLVGLEGLELLLEAFLDALDPLAGDPVVRVHGFKQLAEALQFRADHVPLEGASDRDEAERGVGDDDAVPLGGGRPREEPLALALAKFTSSATRMRAVG